MLLAGCRRVLRGSQMNASLLLSMPSMAGIAQGGVVQGVRGAPGRDFEELLELKKNVVPSPSEEEEAELKARDFVALVAAGVGAETEVGVAQRLLLQAQTALASYADPEWSAQGWRNLTTKVLELARAVAHPAAAPVVAAGTGSSRARATGWRPNHTTADRDCR